MHVHHCRCLLDEDENCEAHPPAQRLQPEDVVENIRRDEPASQNQPDQRPPPEEDDAENIRRDLPPGQNRSYGTFTSYDSTRLFLNRVKHTGKIGSERYGVEHNPEAFSLFNMLHHTLPREMLAFQAIWSIVVTLGAYTIGDKSKTTFGTEFWTSRYVVSSHVVSGVGWALFVLLGFFIKEASGRYKEALFKWNQITHNLRQLVRHFIQVYPAGTWHDGDLDRIIAHLTAYPIALKMTLRKEREADQLSSILHPKDVDDVIEADVCHLQCMRVVRAYHAAAEDDTHAFESVPAEKTPAGWGTRYIMMDIMDGIDLAAGAMNKIAVFQPAIGYVNHLRIFMYIWFLFLPLSVVKTSGWFTILWSVLITYGIGMLYVIAHALNDPFGYDIQDIKLNRLSAETAGMVLDCYVEESPLLSRMIRPERSPTLRWLEHTRDDQNPLPRSSSWVEFASENLGRIASENLGRLSRVRLVIIPMIIYALWVLIVVVSTWALAGNNRSNPSTRWWIIYHRWSTYIPIDSSTVSLFGLGVFLLLGFWLEDAYSRYWQGLQNWHTTIRTQLETVAFQLLSCVRPGLWHEGDKKRILSFLIALPYAVREHLRNIRNKSRSQDPAESKDFSELNDVLSSEDLNALRNSKDSPQHCLHVIHGYINSLDSEDSDTLQDGRSPVRVSSIYSIQYALWDLETAVQECESLQKFPISESFTVHLNLCTALWLGMLPLSLVLHDGFLSCIYLLPIGYSVIKLLSVGTELANPFGKDRYDVPVTLFCEEMKSTMHQVYQTTFNGLPSTIQDSSYPREHFDPQYFKPEIQDFIQEYGSFKRSAQEDVSSVLHPLQRLFISASSGDRLSMVISIAWSVVAVLLSYILSFTWETKCKPSQEWCSPIDVNTDVLADTGFALFLILSFRAADSIGRYEDGAELFQEIDMHLRSLAIEIVQTVQQGVWHSQDHERIVAHIAQIPIALKGALLGEEQNYDGQAEEMPDLLSAEDYRDLTNYGSSLEQLDHCLRVLETYIITMDTIHHENDRAQAPIDLTWPLLDRVINVRKLAYRALGTKRFPVVPSYTNHQRFFACIWLALLPLGIAPNNGFFAIFWTPLVSYGIIALGSISAKLVDPFGADDIDLPVEKMCNDIVYSVLEGVHSVEWGCEKHLEGDRIAGLDRPDELLQLQEYRHIPISQPVGSANFPEGPSLSDHIKFSVPWRVLEHPLAWTALVVVFSFVTGRAGFDGERWWRPIVTVNGKVASYISIPAFLLLGFFVNAAFQRYNKAGSIWGGNLQSTCHALAAQWMILHRPGTWHEGDYERVISHIAAIPIALKLELRKCTDCTDFHGLLSVQDVHRLRNAESMTNYCIDVVRSYVHSPYSHAHLLRNPENATMGANISFIKFEINAIERAIRMSKFIRDFQIAPGFVYLLNTLLFIWFALLPFVLAESSGWWTVLWAPLITYSLLGMYAVAEEIQQPFGSDLNDFDLDTIAANIKQDVLNVYQQYRGGLSELLPSGFPLRDQDVTPNIWRSTSHDLIPSSSSRSRSFHNIIQASYSISNIWHLARHAVPSWVLLASALWSIFSILLSYSTQDHGTGYTCKSLWWCSPVNVSNIVKKDIGFALFLLLGFRLSDSHRRYVHGLRLWKGNMVNFTRLLANRFFSTHHDRSFHSGDLQRVAGYLGAFATTTVSELRNGEECEQILDQLLSPADVRGILSTHPMHQKSDYCLDVLRAYLVKSEELYRNGEYPSGLNEKWLYGWYLMKLRNSAAESLRISWVPLPNGFVHHLRIFLFVWAMLLPLGVVESQGWLTVFYTLLIVYGVVGVDRWSEELSNPFGHDPSDVPLDDLRDEVIRVLRTNLNLFREGTNVMVQDDRPPFRVSYLN